MYYTAFSVSLKVSLNTYQYYTSCITCSIRDFVLNSVQVRLTMHCSLSHFLQALLLCGVCCKCVNRPIA